jgi:hypothetical protein
MTEGGDMKALRRVEGSFQGAFLSRVPHVGAWSVTLAGIDGDGVFHFAEVQWEDSGALR